MMLGWLDGGGGIFFFLCGCSFLSTSHIPSNFHQFSSTAYYSAILYEKLRTLGFGG
jgi:hypothetical protein